MSDLRVFLGILEFLVLSQMDLPDSLRRFLEDFRNAGIGLFRLPTLCPGVVRALPPDYRNFPMDGQTRLPSDHPGP